MEPVFQPCCSAHAIYSIKCSLLHFNLSILRDKQTIILMLFWHVWVKPSRPKSLQIDSYRMSFYSLGIFINSVMQIWRFFEPYSSVTLICHKRYVLVSPSLCDVIYEWSLTCTCYLTGFWLPLASSPSKSRKSRDPVKKPSLTTSQRRPPTLGRHLHWPVMTSQWLS